MSHDSGDLDARRRCSQKGQEWGDAFPQSLFDFFYMTLQGKKVGGGEKDVDMLNSEKICWHSDYRSAGTFRYLQAGVFNSIFLPPSGNLLAGGANLPFHPPLHPGWRDDFAEKVGGEEGEEEKTPCCKVCEKRGRKDKNNKCFPRAAIKGGGIREKRHKETCTQAHTGEKQEEAFHHPTAHSAGACGGEGKEFFSPFFPPTQ